MMRDAAWAFAEHAATTRLDQMPAAAIARAKVFLLDSLGVGIVGSAAPWVEELLDAQASFGVDPSCGAARVLASGRVLPGPAAALANAYQIHNSEFDCVHEQAVVHPMAVLLGAMSAYADMRGGISGEAFLTALILGVDIAAGLGVASKAPLTFFRPATAGGFGAAAALARLRGLDTTGVLAAMSIAYGQMGGTMQAHTEGKALLAMQAGFNARNAVLAVELAARGMEAPEHILEGPYGYFANFEGDHDVQAVAATLGKTWRITEVAHKPFPSGRATHGLVDAALQLARRHGFTAAEIDRVDCRTPSLTQRLIGRPAHDRMTPNYARLSGQYVVATAFLRNDVGVEDFSPAAIAAPKRLGLAGRIHIAADDNPDPNAMSPIAMKVRLASGARHEIRLEAIYGAPANPMPPEAHLAKFYKNCANAAPVVPGAQAARLEAAVAGIEGLADIRDLIDLCIAPAP